MLLVQYLYAATTLKTGDPLAALRPEARKAVGAWRTTLRHVAIEEMGHLMGVQNLRLFASTHPGFDREAFPPTVDVYPFPLHLEPLSSISLAKYVLAEAPFSADAELDPYRQIVGTSASVRHVGVIYGLLAVLFSSPETLPPPDATDDWSRFVSRVAAAARRTDPGPWHVPEDAFDPASVARQADPAHFSANHEGFFFERVGSTAEARDLIQRIGEQGEAPVEAPGQPSHYRRFRRMFEGDGSTVGFPTLGQFAPALDVDVDPRIESYEGQARAIAIGLDAAYASMLELLLQYFAAATETARASHAADALARMTDVQGLARELVLLPQKAEARGWPRPSSPSRNRSDDRSQLRGRPVHDAASGGFARARS